MNIFNTPLKLCLNNFGRFTTNKLQYLQTYSKNGQVNQQASADRPVSSLLGPVRTLQLVVDPS